MLACGIAVSRQPTNYVVDPQPWCLVKKSEEMKKPTRSELCLCLDNKLANWFSLSQRGERREVISGVTPYQVSVPTSYNYCNQQQQL